MISKYVLFTCLHLAVHTWVQLKYRSYSDGNITIVNYTWKVFVLCHVNNLINKIHNEIITCMDHSITFNNIFSIFYYHLSTFMIFVIISASRQNCQGTETNSEISVKTTLLQDSGKQLKILIMKRPHKTKIK